MSDATPEAPASLTRAPLFHNLALSDTQMIARAAPPNTSPGRMKRKITCAPSGVNCVMRTCPTSRTYNAAAGEEAQLYPLMDYLVRAHGKPTATMSTDHEYIKNYMPKSKRRRTRSPTPRPTRKTRRARSSRNWGYN